MIRPARAVVFGAAYAFLAGGAQLATLSHASGQWLPDRSYTEGPGFRVGDLELHPGVAVRAGYDTNVFRQPGTRSAPENDAVMLGVTPHLHLSTLGAQRRTQGEDAAGAAAAAPPPVAFDFGVSATYFKYFKVANAPTNVEVDLDGVLNVLPNRVFGFDVGATYARNIRPFTAELDKSNTRYALNRIRPSLILRAQSRGGVFKARAGFAPALTIYESSTFRYLNQNQYEVPVGLSWQFLPNTALVYDAAYSFNDYTNPNNGDSTERAVFLSDSHRLASRAGINGAITRNIAARVLAGYGVVFQKERLLDDHEDGIGEAALTFAWSPKDKAEIGYQRLLEISALSGWTQLDRGFLKSDMLLAQRLALGLEAGVAHVNYGKVLQPDGTGAGVNDSEKRDDIRIDGAVHVEVRATNWLAFLADFSALATLTDFEYDRGSAVPPYPGRFKTFQVFGGIRAHY